MYKQKEEINFKRRRDFIMFFFYVQLHAYITGIYVYTYIYYT